MTLATATPHNRRYLNLCRHLEALPDDRQEFVLSFAEISDLIAGPLPSSARLGHFWSSSSVARANWEFSGFKARLQRPGPAVAFVRRSLSR
jgi:hypothetical protein